MESVGHLASLL